MVTWVPKVNVQYQTRLPRWPYSRAAPGQGRRPGTAECGAGNVGLRSYTISEILSVFERKNSGIAFWIESTALQQNDHHVYSGATRRYECCSNRFSQGRRENPPSPGGILGQYSPWSATNINPTHEKYRQHDLDSIMELTGSNRMAP